MKYTYLLTLVTVLAPSWSAAQNTVTAPSLNTHSDKTIKRIAFGSCNNPRKKNCGMLNQIVDSKPDIFIFVGDNMYGDTTDMKVFKSKYDELENQTGFKKLRNICPIIATWDDHDFGTNDGGKSFTKKEQSQKLLLDFFQEPQNSLRRKTPGIYCSYTFGKTGKKCQIIMLDTRYFSDELPIASYKKGTKPKNIRGRYRPTQNKNKTLLGQAQWKWLEQELQQPADIRSIVSSIQILASEKGMESWGNVPHEEQRLYQLLKKHKAHGTFAISGDVHYAELPKKEIGGYSFYDLTSSGMTHTKPSWAKYTNTKRVGNAYAEFNAGLIDIDWNKKEINLQIIDKNGKSVITKKLNISNLRFP